MKRIECRYTGIGGKYLTNAPYSNITDMNLIKLILNKLVSTEGVECFCDIERDLYFIDIFHNEEYMAGIVGEKIGETTKVSFFDSGSKKAKNFINSYVIPQFKKAYRDLGYNVDLQPEHHSTSDLIDTGDWTKLKIGGGYLWR